MGRRFLCIAFLERSYGDIEIVAGITVSFKFDAHAALKRMGKVRFRNVAGRWGRKTAISLEHRAKQNAPVDMGRLRASITHRIIEIGNGVIARTGSNVKYAAFQEFGTGIYGPRKRLIRPVRAKVLSWKPKSGKRVFVKFVRGVRPKRYFTKALVAERPVANMRLDEEVKREMEKP